LFGTIGRYLIFFIDIIFISWVIYIIVRNIGETKFVGTIQEFIPTLLFVSFIVNVTGSLLDRINGTRMVAVYPAIIATIGGVGSIIGSTATTKLALGLIKPSFSSLKEHINEVGGAWLASIVMFLVYALLSVLISSVNTLEELLVFTGQLLTTNVVAIAVMLFVAYAVAISTFRRGLNPDNFVIPVESSLADTVTTAAALLALALIV